MIPWWRTDLGEAEIRAVERSIRDRHINNGPVCREFERRLAERLGVPYAVTCTNGSSALYLALAACGVAPGDEVIVPAMTYIATAHAVMLRSAKVRLVDVRPDRPVIDADAIEPAVSERTRAIIAVHLNGAACDMDRINAIARRYNLAVIEDTAQALGSKGLQGALGTLGNAGTFSMSIAKLMTTGEGGFVVTRDEETYQKLLRLRNHGVQDVANNVFDAFGFNFRFTDVLASIGLVQLAALNEKIDAARRTYEFYRDGLAGLKSVRPLVYHIGGGELPLWAQVVCGDRDRTVALLEQRGIQGRPINPPLCDSPHLDCPGAFPNARRLAGSILGLPSGPDQDPEDLQRVAEALCEIDQQLPALPADLEGFDA